MQVRPFDIEQIRADFPILGRKVYGKYPLVYLDNAATTQKPRMVVESMVEEYYNVNANVHRGVHFLSQQATDLHEQSRETVRQFIGAGSTSEILFTRGTTESINLVASCFGQAFMHEGDEVIVTEMEHHSNIVPWQLLQARQGIRIRVVPMNDEGYLSLDALESLFNERTRLLCVAHVSNVLGTVNPVEQIIRMAHAHEVPVLVDGAQSTPHMPIDVTQMDCAETFIFRGSHAFFIEPEKLFRLAGLYDCAEVVLFAIGGILRQVQDFSEGSCTGLLRIAGGSCKGHPSGERHYCKPQIDELVWYSHTFSFLLGSSCNKVSISLKKSNI